jgi:hypothetical protein
MIAIRLSASVRLPWEVVHPGGSQVGSRRGTLVGLGRLQRAQAAGGAVPVGRPAWGAFMIG